MSQHTPGPWVVQVGTGKICDVAQTTHIATMAPTCVTPIWEANAHLIEAAPEMRTALTGCLRAMQLLSSAVFMITTRDQEAVMLAHANARALLARRDTP